MLDEHARLDRSGHEQDCGGDQCHDECGALRTETAVAFALRGQRNPHASPADRSHNKRGGEICQAHQETAQSQFGLRPAWQFDTNAIELTDRESQPDEKDTEHKTAASHFFREETTACGRPGGGLQGETLKVRCEIVSALAELGGVRIRQETTRTFKRHRLAHFTAILMLESPGFSAPDTVVAPEDAMTHQPRSFQFALPGALFAATAVAAGAFGAHALKTILDPSMLAVYDTAARYQMYHALGLFVVAWLCRETKNPWSVKAGWLFCAGILLFSGSLYIVALAGIKWMGALTPLGGVSFIAGWICIVLAAWRAGHDQ